MSLPINEEELFLEAEGVRLPAKLTRPAGEPPRWGIVIIPGSMANDVDGNYPETGSSPHLYADLARQLAGHGHAVLRYAKEGAQTGSVVVDEAASQAPRDRCRDGSRGALPKGLCRARHTSPA